LFDLMFHWSEWIKPSAGLPTVQWALLLAVAAAMGHALQRRWGLPKVLGYSMVGALAGFSGYTTVNWPLDGIAQFLIELGLSIVLFGRAVVCRCAGCDSTPCWWCRASPKR
jgi:NhaP-type Na+/H+ and K+/H+ antiporter